MLRYTEIFRLCKVFLDREKRFYYLIDTYFFKNPFILEKNNRKGDASVKTFSCKLLCIDIEFV